MSCPPKALLRQTGCASTVETRIAHHFAMLENVPIYAATLATVEEYADLLQDGIALPIGSVEFMRKVMACLALEEPANISYPEALQAFLQRDVRQRRAGQVLGTHFVKPTTTKCFTGFVFDTMTDPATLEPHVQEQHEAFMALDARTPVWVSEPVCWQTEVRYYVCENQVLGYGRYDDGPDDWPMPDERCVQSMVEAFAQAGAPAAYTLDVGVLDSGETALVECNDAWAVGFYKGTLSPRDYVRMLWARWQQIRFAAS